MFLVGFGASVALSFTVFICGMAAIFNDEDEDDV